MAGASDATSAALAFSRTQRASAEDEELAGLEAGITGVFLGVDFDFRSGSLTPSALRLMTSETNAQFKRLVSTSPDVAGERLHGRNALDSSRRAGRSC
jgi:hypothetical protein